MLFQGPASTFKAYKHVYLDTVYKDWQIPPTEAKYPVYERGILLILNLQSRKIL